MEKKEGVTGFGSRFSVLGLKPWAFPANRKPQTANRARRLH